MDQKTKFYSNFGQKTKKRYLKLHHFHQISKDKNLRLCPKRNCEGTIKINQAQKKKCNVCKREFCQKCFYQVHKGDCEVHQLKILENNLHYRQCSNCKVIIEKIEGCNHIKCKCGYQFCYICGSKWQISNPCHIFTAVQQVVNHDDLHNRNSNCRYQKLRKRCRQTCGGTLTFMVTFPICLVLSILWVIWQILCFLGFLLVIVFGVLFIGAMFQSFDFIREKCLQGRLLIGLLYLVFYPAAFGVEAYRSMIFFLSDKDEMSIQCIKQILNEQIIDPFEVIWCGYQGLN